MATQEQARSSTTAWVLADCLNSFKPVEKKLWDCHERCVFLLADQKHIAVPWGAAVIELIIVYA